MFKSIILVCVFAFALQNVYADAADKMCDAQTITHCTAVGYQTCRKIGSLQECYCPHAKNWTSIDAIVDELKTCKIDSGKYLDPNYWFQDVMAATFITIVVLFLVTWCYLIPTHAKTCALYEQLGEDRPLHYWPSIFQTKHYYTLAPNGSKTKSRAF